MTVKKRRRLLSIMWAKKQDDLPTSIFFRPSVYHAVIVIFLEFFSWGLLTSPVINVLNKTFPQQTFLMNGLIQGIKGFLSFLSAPLVGALSDIWGRKPFLIVTVSFTCMPIPLMQLFPGWYFAMISLSGIFAVTFSIVFAYVADVTTEAKRSSAFALVSASFAASLVTSPAIGAYLESLYDETFVICLATLVAILDVLYIIFIVPESLPASVKPSKMSWDRVDPFGALRKIGQDGLILMLCVATFLANLPEAGEYSCFFVYLRLVIQFSKETVAAFIAVIGILSVISQTVFLSMLMKVFGSRKSIMIGLAFEALQLLIYGFGSQNWLMWVAGILAALGMITYPAISAFVSTQAQADQQGVAQGVITGIRGLCNGLGPALYGVVFFLFDVNLNEPSEGGVTLAPAVANVTMTTQPHTSKHSIATSLMPGPPFAFGAALVMVALCVAYFIPETSRHPSVSRSSSRTSSRTSSCHEPSLDLPLQQFSPGADHRFESAPLMTVDIEELS